MAAYIVATVNILDPERFSAYVRNVDVVREAFGGERLLAGPVKEVLEGDGQVGERVVVIRFPDAEAARGYIASAEYQAVKARRQGAAIAVMRLVVD